MFSTRMLGRKWPGIVSPRQVYQISAASNFNQMYSSSKKNFPATACSIVYEVRDFIAVFVSTCAGFKLTRTHDSLVE